MKEHGFCLHKSVFRDALALCYGWLPHVTPADCSCSKPFSIEHSLSCSKGGFPTLGHNEIRDTTAILLTDKCFNVCIKPQFQPLSGEELHGATTIRDDAARVDIAANGFWGGSHERAYFDVRVFSPYAVTNR